MAETGVQYSLRNTLTGARVTISKDVAAKPLTASEFRDGWRVIEKRTITYGEWETVQESHEAPETPQKVRTPPKVTPKDIGRRVSVPAPGGGRVSGVIRGVGGNKGLRPPVVTVRVPQGLYPWSADEVEFEDG